MNLRRLHYLCTFRRRQDKNGQVYFTATLGNSRLLLFPENDGKLQFFLGGQIIENKSLQDDFRDTITNRLDLDAVAYF